MRAEHCTCKFYERWAELCECEFDESWALWILMWILWELSLANMNVMRTEVCECKFYEKWECELYECGALQIWD